MSNQKAPQTYMVGNWKMNHSTHEVNEFFNDLKKCDLGSGNYWIAPQSIHIYKAVQKTNELPLKIGAQNCSEHESGAFTGEISPASIKDLEADFVILGHSERRAIFKETNQVINKKVKAALKCELVPILCVGESLDQREAGKTMEVVLDQLTSGLEGVSLSSPNELIVAYEPVWAIGTGKTASPDQAETVHAKIRSKLSELYPECGAQISILYGGSVKPSNVQELLNQPNVNGGLVGGASLKAQDFAQLCKATK